MKKKILLAIAMIAMLVCIFAVSVSAVEIDGLYYSLTESESGNTATLTTENVKCEGKTVDGRPNVVIIPETVTYGEKTYTVTEIAWAAFAGGNGWPGNKVAKEIYVPKTVTTIGEHCFRNCTAVTKIEIDGGDQAFSNAEFYGCSSLVELDLSEMTRLDSMGRSCIHYCGSLTTLKLPDGLQKMEGQDFSVGCSSLTEIVIPDSVTVIGDKIFQGATNLNSIKLSSNLEVLGCNNFQNSKATEIIIPGTLTTIRNHVFHGSQIQKIVFASTNITTYDARAFEGASKLKVVFYPAKTEDEAKMFASQFNLIKGWTNFVSYADYLANPDATYTNTIVYGTENCSGCYDLSTKSTDTFLFTDYMSPMYDAKVCSNCQATTKGTEYAPMFSGYLVSMPEDGRMAICVGYSINAASVAKYESETGKTISYGIVAAGESNLAGNAPLDENGNAYKPENGVVVKAPLDKGYSSYDFKLTGLDSLTEAVNVVIATYVTEGNGYVYLQDGVVDGTSFAVITVGPNA